MYPLGRDAAPTLVSLWAVLILDYIKATTHGGLEPYHYALSHEITLGA